MNTDNTPELKLLKAENALFDKMAIDNFIEVTAEFCIKQGCPLEALALKPEIKTKVQKKIMETLNNEK